MLQGGVVQHGHQRLPVQPRPGSTLEVVKVEFLLHLLVSPLAQPARLDGARQATQAGVRRQVGPVGPPLARRAVLVHEPHLLVAGRMLVGLATDASREAVRDTHPQGGGRAFSRPLARLAAEEVG